MEIIEIGEGVIANEIKTLKILLDIMINNFISDFRKVVEKFKEYHLRIKVNDMVIFNPIQALRKTEKNKIILLFIVDNIDQYIGLLHKHDLIKVDFA
jgi:hypothetical protein